MSHPHLSEDGQRQAVELIEAFKESLVRAADEAIGGLYQDFAAHIETDAWFNYRNELFAGLKDYPTQSKQRHHDFKRIRNLIFTEYRDRLIHDLNQDHLEEIESLKTEIRILRGTPL